MAKNQPVYQGTTAFDCDGTGFWTFASVGTDDSADLVHINIHGRSKKVELSVAMDDWSWALLERPIITCFSNDEAQDGIFLMSNWTDTDGKDDLIFIKTRNTKSGYIELAVASAGSDYRSRVFEQATRCKPANPEATFRMSDQGDLIQLTHCVVRGNIGAARYAVWNRGSDYQYESHSYIVEMGDSQAMHSVSPYCQPDEAIPDMYITRGVERQDDGDLTIHRYSAKSSFQNDEWLKESSIKANPGGIWFTADCTNSATPDMVFLKMKNNLSGRVEISIWQI